MKWQHALLLTLLCKLESVVCKGIGAFGGSASAGRIGAYTPATSSYTTSYGKGGKMSGSSWGKGKSARTSGGSRIYTLNSRHHSVGPRTYYGGNSYRGPRYYNGARTSEARATAVVTGTTYTALWSRESGARYDFYDKSKWCPNEGFFRFGGTCRRCSTNVCPDGQYRVACTPGSDSYCTKCNNVCLKFNEDPFSNATSLPGRGTCLEARDPDFVFSSGVCDPNNDPFTCTYTSEGTPGKGVSDCQIESCCVECSNDEEAFLEGKGSVCQGSTKGLEMPDDTAYLLFDGEFPMRQKLFRESLTDTMRVIANVAKVDVKNVKADSSLIEDFKLCDLGSGQTYCTLDPTVERQEGDEEFATIASFTLMITAKDIDVTWNRLSEDNINAALYANGLPPMIMYQAAGLNDDETWLDKNGKSIVIGVLIAGGILGCLSFTAIVILSNGYCGTGTQESGVWDTENWESGYPKPNTANLEWVKLSDEEKMSAAALGYDSDMWDNDQQPKSLSEVQYNNPSYSLLQPGIVTQDVPGGPGLPPAE